GDDRPHDRHRWVLLPALSAPRAARPGRARLSQHRPLRGEEAALRSGPSVPQRHVAGVFRALVSFITWDELKMDRTQKIAMGFAFGSGFLDLGIIRNGILDWPPSFKLLASAPHLILGSVAMFSGFVLGKD